MGDDLEDDEATVLHIVDAEALEEQNNLKITTLIQFSLKIHLRIKKFILVCVEYLLLHKNEIIQIFL